MITHLSFFLCDVNKVLAPEHCHRINVSCLENKFFHTSEAAGDFYCATAIYVIFLSAATTLRVAVTRKNCWVSFTTPFLPQHPFMLYKGQVQRCWFARTLHNYTHRPGVYPGTKNRQKLIHTALNPTSELVSKQQGWGQAHLLHRGIHTLKVEVFTSVTLPHLTHTQVGRCCRSRSSCTWSCLHPTHEPLSMYSCSF